MLSGLVEWWDGAELWLTQRGFVMQFALVMAVLVPVCLVLALLIDKSVGKVVGWLGAHGAAGEADLCHKTDGVPWGK